jgi:hypothetical protein
VLVRVVGCKVSFDALRNALSRTPTIFSGTRIPIVTYIFYIFWCRVDVLDRGPETPSWRLIGQIPHFLVPRGVADGHETPGLADLS